MLGYCRASAGADAPPAVAVVAAAPIPAAAGPQGRVLLFYRYCRVRRLLRRLISMLLAPRPLLTARSAAATATGARPGSASGSADRTMHWCAQQLLAAAGPRPFPAATCCSSLSLGRYLLQLLSWMSNRRCVTELGLTGRIRIAAEGINGACRAHLRPVMLPESVTMNSSAISSATGAVQAQWGEASLPAMPTRLQRLGWTSWLGSSSSGGRADPRTLPRCWSESGQPHANSAARRLSPRLSSTGFLVHSHAAECCALPTAPFSRSRSVRRSSPWASRRTSSLTQPPALTSLRLSSAQRRLLRCATCSAAAQTLSLFLGVTV